MTIALKRAPRYTMVNGQSGAVAVDSTGLDLADYPSSEIVAPAGADEVLFYWTANSLTGGDTIGVEAIVLSSGARAATVVSGATSVPETPAELVPLPVEVVAPAPDVEADSSGVVSHAATSNSAAKRLINLVGI